MSVTLNKQGLSIQTLISKIKTYVIFLTILFATGMASQSFAIDKAFIGPDGYCRSYMWQTSGVSNTNSMIHYDLQKKDYGWDAINISAGPPYTYGANQNIYFYRYILTIHQGQLYWGYDAVTSDYFRIMFSYKTASQSDVDAFIADMNSLGIPGNWKTPAENGASCGCSQAHKDLVILNCGGEGLVDWTKWYAAGCAGTICKPCADCPGTRETNLGAPPCPATFSE